MLKESARRRDENVHARQPLSLVLQVLPTNDEPSGEAMEPANATQDVEYLDGLWDIGKRPTDAHVVYCTHKFSCRRYDQRAQAILRSPLSTVQNLQHGDEERESFPAACAGCTQDIFAFERSGDALGLDIRHVDEVCMFEA